MLLATLIMGQPAPASARKAAAPAGLRASAAAGTSATTLPLAPTAWANTRVK